MKKWKAILFGTLLTLSLCTFTACGTEVNNADETVDEKNNDERNKKKNTNENTATENGIMEDETDNDGVMDNGGIIEDSGTDNNEMAGGNITVTPAGNGNNTTAAPGTTDANGTGNDGTVSGELGDSVKDLLHSHTMKMVCNCGNHKSCQKKQKTHTITQDIFFYGVGLSGRRKRHKKSHSAVCLIIGNRRN